MLFVSIGYIFVSENIKKVDTPALKVPYTQEKPENAGILFNINGNESYVYLDFNGGKITVSLQPELPVENEIYGYPLDYNVTATSDLVGEIADYLNGLELNVDGNNYRYTGAGVMEILEKQNSIDLEREIIKSICERITVSRPKVDFFAEIIENSETNLKITDCYFWDDYIVEICENLHFID